MCFVSLRVCASGSACLCVGLLVCLCVCVCVLVCFLVCLFTCVWAWLVDCVLDCEFISLSERSLVCLSVSGQLPVASGKWGGVTSLRKVQRNV